MKYQVGKKEIELEFVTKEQADEIVNDALKDDLTLERNYRKIANLVLKQDEKYISERSQKRVKTLTISIQWYKNRTWGNCPRAEVSGEYADGSGIWDYSSYSATGYGYDKESTVVAEIFNKYLKYLLWEKHDAGVRSGNRNVVPYGIVLKDDYVYYSSGVGIGCYFNIAEFLGGELERVATGNKFDVYKLTLEEV